MEKIEFTIQDKTYELPEYISVEQYIQLFKLKDVLSVEYFSIKIISILSGCPEDILHKVNYNDIKFLASYCIKLFPKPKEEFISTFTIDGIEYGFIDSWKKLSFGEWVDLDTLMNKDADEVTENIHIILAIMYRPIIERKKKKYVIEEYNEDTMIERAELFKKKLDIKVYFGTLVFFYQFAEKYKIRILLSSMKKHLWRNLKLLWKYRKIIKILSRGNGDGFLSSTDFQEMILQSMNMSQKPNWWQRLTKWRTSSQKTRKQNVKLKIKN